MRLSDNLKEQLASAGREEDARAVRVAFQGRVPAIFFMEDRGDEGKEFFIVQTDPEDKAQRRLVCMLDTGDEIELNRATQFLADTLGVPVYGVRFAAYDIASVAYPEEKTTAG